jgi:putative acetyltransferase
MIVRPEQPGDAAKISAIHADSFPTDGEARLVEQLRASKRLIASLVADENGQLVGHVAFSPVSVASGAPGAGLAPIAVAAPHRRRRIAAELVRAGLQACHDLDYGWAVVLGESDYYSRFGFRPAAEFGLEDEYGGGSAFQAIELIPGTLPMNAGRVKYAPEFAAFV